MRKFQIQFWQEIRYTYLISTNKKACLFHLFKFLSTKLTKEYITKNNKSQLYSCKSVNYLLSTVVTSPCHFYKTYYVICTFKSYKLISPCFTSNLRHPSVTWAHIHWVASKYSNECRKLLQVPQGILCLGISH